MGGALPKRGVGALSSEFFFAAFNHERAPMPCLQRPMPSELITGQTIVYNGATSSFEVKADGTQHSEWHYVTTSSWCMAHYLCPSMQSCHVITFNEVAYCRDAWPLWVWISKSTASTIRRCSCLSKFCSMLPQGELEGLAFEEQPQYKWRYSVVFQF